MGKARNAPWQQCPARGPGLSHTQDAESHPDGRCVYCGVPFDFVNTRWGTPESAAPTNIEPTLRREYNQVRKEGLEDRDAQAFVAHLHGLGPADDQKQPWSLEELNDLMKVKKEADLGLR